MTDNESTTDGVTNMKKLVYGTKVGLLAVTVLAAHPSRLRAELTGLPEGPGLAGTYPGDAGIDKDPDVVFAENFEERSLDVVFRCWNDVPNGGRLVIACAQIGQGRVVACGIAIGLRHGDADTRPTGPELALLRNVLKWLAGK